ncbi:methyl-accepting chemotaxis sensory transducer with Pas/Pac sensor [Crenobacter luteus]|uniref:methyl-accepting chemotaxis protein n=1 Tax=Crenobacter luteus TaxID=1452487 RepID=UPI0010535AA9|nr:PAS domain-containing methyl-accepting chemotaxis protein [Crenobacter luteus]TCP11604.1 methyl-accepting chemotaxis sensory transducer with Pas/Pac sensor [Crenobacter luteus]
MKINLPVTDQERRVDPAHPIVTKTDAKGLITYANRAFIEISGFDEAELIGKNHNVVRHPDMPPEAFADLWETVKTGQPWRGLVKNRAKNGDFYWVEAYVTPITEHGRIVGYMSIRSCPNRAEVDAAEALYRAVRDKRATLPSTLAARRRRLDPLKWGGLGVGAGALLLLAAGLAPELSWGARAALSGAGFAVGAAAGAWAALRVAESLRVLQQGFAWIAEGQLEHSLAVSVGGLAGRLVANLESLRILQRAVIADVVSASGRTHANADSLEAEMRGLAVRSAEQVQGLTQISGNMEMMSEAVAEVATLAEQSLSDAEATKEVAGAGSATMVAASQAAERAVEVVGASRAAVDKLTRSMADIRSMTDQIHEIADQTNLLALNASIEAARAGETGRGFAVVADEVRKLAERTSKTTDAITGIVESIAATTREAVGSMDATVSEVGEVTEQIRASSGNLAGLIGSAERASAQARHLAEQMRQKSQAVHEVAASLEQLNAIAQSNLQTTHLVETHAGELAETAGDLAKLTRDFRKWNR